MSSTVVGKDHRAWWWPVVGIHAVFAVGLFGCRTPTVAPPPSQASPSVRAATSFLHCLERTGSTCVEPTQASAGLEAFFWLRWVSEGPPTTWWMGLPYAPDRLPDARGGEQHLVAEVERYAAALRGSACEPVAEESLVNLISSAHRDGSARLERLGLTSERTRAALTWLAEVATEDLKQGVLVRFECEYDPFTVYLAVVPEAGELRVVGMTTVMPESLMGRVLSTDQIEQRLKSKLLLVVSSTIATRGDTLSPWLPFEVEAF